MHRSIVAACVCVGLIALSARAGEVALPSACGHDIEQREYHATIGADGIWSAPNRAQDLRFEFCTDGVVARPRTSGVDFEWGLRLVSFGRHGSPMSLPRATLSSSANRVEATRGDLVEWYVNDARGLEHGFTVAASPAGRGDLVLELDVTGTLTPCARDGGIDFASATDDAAIRYDHLVVVDADGRVLDARMGVHDGSIRITVDDRDARYPVTIDPLTTTAAWTGESNQAGAAAGTSAASAGDVNGDGYSDVIVGAPLFDNGQIDEGRVFVYLGSATGLALTAAWTVEVNQAGAQFGSSVACAGDVNGDGFSDVMVGAPMLDNGQTDEGRVYVYLGSPIGLAAAAVWTTESDQANAHYGACVSTCGDVNGDGRSDVIIGAPDFDNGNTNEGRAYFYRGTATGLANVAAWVEEGNFNQAHFGISVAATGDVNADGFADFAVGAPGFEATATQDTGRAYVVHGTAASMPAGATWTFDGTAFNGGLGFAVAAAGDVNGDGYADLIVGEPEYNLGEGRASEFNGSATGLPTTASWQDAGGFSDSWSTTVACAGDTNADGYGDVLVGTSQGLAGRARMYQGSPSGLHGGTGGTVWGGNGAAGAEYATAVACAGDVDGDGCSDIIVGAPGFSGGQSGEGRALVYLGSRNPIQNDFYATGVGGPFKSAFGQSVAAAGDVNGDGYSDVVIGAPTYKNSQTDEGAAMLHLGSATGVAPTAAWTFESNSAGAKLGNSVAGAGDVDGDGYADTIVGAELAGTGGMAYVHLGSVTGLSSTASWQVANSVAGARFGHRVASAGDVNGDGFLDVVVGASRWNDAESEEGAAFVYLGSPLGLSTTPAWSVASNQVGAQLGFAVASAGDVNGDGFSDVAIGVRRFDSALVDAGRADVYMGSSLGLGASPAWSVNGSVAGSEFGAAVGSAGDTNGDGCSDLLVGAPLFTQGQTEQGQASLYLGSAAGLATTAAWAKKLPNANAHLGTAVGGGDLNGDGLSDVLVGAPTYEDVPGIQAGKLLVFYSTSAGVPTAVDLELMEGGVDSGTAFAATDDVNGDGLADLINATPSSSSNSGAVFVHLSNGGDGSLLRPRQIQLGNSAPIAPLGRMQGAKFKLEMKARSAFGRTVTKLVLEAKPLGTAFSNVGQISSPWLSTKTTDTSGVTTPVLAAATSYHWRARIVYSATTVPPQPATHWFSLSHNASTEADLRSAPCGESFATSSSYGSGKPGTNGIPKLISLTPPALGGIGDLTLSKGLGGAGPLVYFFGFVQTALPFDGGTLLVLPQQTITLPGLPPSGELTIPFALPAAPAFCGANVYFQAAFVDPGATGFYHLAMTPGVKWTLGS